MVQDAYKNKDSLYNFKKAIKKLKAENCPCRICKIFVKNIGFCETGWIIIFLKPVVFYILIFFIEYFKIYVSKSFIRKLTWINMFLFLLLKQLFLLVYSTISILIVNLSTLIKE